jgi:hypothetical protein
VSAVAVNYLSMTPEDRSRIETLCAQIAVEKDHRRFYELLAELNDLLQRSHQRDFMRDPDNVVK